MTELYQPGMYIGSRPDWLPKDVMGVNKATGQARVMTERGMVVNSLLRKDEWQDLDQQIQQASLIRLNGVAHLRQGGLVKGLPSIGILNAQFSQADEMTAATSNMTGQGGDGDRVDFAIINRPVPITFKPFTIPKRELEAARLINTSLDTAHATAASRVVAEKLEDMLINGDATINFDGGVVFGYTTETNRNTGTAAAFGGGDWGTISNIIPTVEGMINTVNGDRYYGPFNIYASTTQYNQATLKRFADGSGQKPSDFIEELPMVNGFFPSDTLADGVVVLVQMTQDVVDWAEHLMITVVEWMSGDGLVGHFKVMAVATPRVKSDIGSRSGVAHATAA